MFVNKLINAADFLHSVLTDLSLVKPSFSAFWI